MQTFECGTRLCFGQDAMHALRTLDARRVLIVTDAFFEKQGIAARVGREFGAEAVRVFAQVQPDPPLTLIAEGIRVLREFQPDTVAALGGGSAIDCAKGMIASEEEKIRLVALPTTSGTGSEVTSFAVLSHDGVKHPLVDPRLRPSVAVLDASLLDELPQAVIADAGMDVATHCVEAIVAQNASPFSDAFALYALRTVLERLPASYRGDRVVREEIHYAATMAGIAFDHAGLGICHALSHALGGHFHVAHGRLNGILLPHVVRFNMDSALKSYANCASYCGVSGVRGLCFAIERLRRNLALPATLQEAGISPDALHSVEAALCEAAAADPCAQTNPRPVTPDALRPLLRAAL